MQSMQVVRDAESVAHAVDALRREGRSIALVPTMGALHAGHLSLVEQGLKGGHAVVASIFVNPTQFGPNEDFARYPRDEAADLAMLEGKAAIAYLPTPEVIYPDGFATSIHVSGVSEGLCGASRPGHFDGVATVVAKLLNQVQSDVAIFGEKDYQQLAVIRRVVADLDMQLRIEGAPILREADGLAMSSRNRYLSEDERRKAAMLYRVLIKAAERLPEGGETALEQAQRLLLDTGFTKVDYIALRDAETLAPLNELNRPARLLAAAWLGNTRLIDNIAVEGNAS